MDDIDKRLDELVAFNKMVHPELDGACSICGINPSLIKQLMADEFDKLIGEDESPAFIRSSEWWRNKLRKDLREKLDKWEKE